MTNQTSEGNRQTDREETETATDGRDQRRTLGRRTALKAAGGLVAGGAALANAGSAAAASYDTITVGAGETRIIRLGDGERLENTLIDTTASGADVRINASGSDWVVRNVAIRGEQTNPHHTIIATVDDGSVGVVENCWFGDGSDQEFVYVHRNHAGTVKVRNCYIENADTGIYGSAPAPGGMHNQTDGNEGEVHVEDCYLKDITYSHFILGTDGSYARGCVVDSPNHDEWNVVFYNRWEHVDVVDCDIRTGGIAFKAGNTSGANTGGDAVTSVQNCRVEADSRTFTGPGSFDSQEVSGTPDLAPPASVPTSAQEAVTGSSSSSSGGSDSGSTGGDSGADPADDGGSGSDSSGGDTDAPSDDAGGSDGSDSSAPTFDRELSIVGTGTEAAYELTVGGDLRATGNVEGGDSVEGSSASGTVEWMSDNYEFSGDLASLSVDGAIDLWIDGEQYDPAEFGATGGDGDSDPSPTYDSELSVVGTGTEAAYELTVDGGLRATDNVEGGDTVGDATTTGTVEWMSDNYEFAGEVTDFEADGPVHLWVNGEEYDAADFE